MMLLALDLTGLSFELCLFISELAGAKLRWLKCVDSTHYGYGLNFQLIQSEAFIQASSNGPSRSGVYSVQTPSEQGCVNCADPERQRDCHYDNPFQYCAISTAVGFVSRRTLCCCFAGIIYSFQKGSCYQHIKKPP